MVTDRHTGTWPEHFKSEIATQSAFQSRLWSFREHTCPGTQAEEFWFCGQLVFQTATEDSSAAPSEELPPGFRFRMPREIQVPREIWRPGSTLVYRIRPWAIVFLNVFQVILMRGQAWVSLLEVVSFDKHNMWFIYIQFSEAYLQVALD